MSEIEKVQPAEGNVEVKKGKEENGNVEVDQGLGEQVVSPEDSGTPFDLSRVSDFDALDIPSEVRRRVKALKKIQVDFTQIESEFFKEMHDLEAKYAPLYAKMFEKRKEIVLGKHEPSDVECEFSVGEADTSDLADSVNKLTLGDKSNETKQPVSGIPEFWLTIFKNVDVLSEMVHDHDLPILKHLADIKVEMTTKPMGFTLFFHFSENEFFTNQVLTKTYEMKCEVDSQDPFSFEGPEIVKCTGCGIDWNEGKNVTVRVVRKKQKHKQQGTIRMVSKTEAVPSFFDFFNPPSVEDPDEDTQIRLTSDFEVGQYIRERIVPRAVLYYTGEALDDDFDDEEEEEDETETDDEEDDDDNVSLDEGQSREQGADDAGERKTNRTRTKANPPECKQQ